LDPQVRILKKTNKAIQSKILAFPSAVRFLQLAGFDFDRSIETIEVLDYRKELLQLCMDALQLHIEHQGGKV